MISFDPGCLNQLLVNPRLSDQEKNTLYELKDEFDLKVVNQGYFLIASSGSSQKSNESVKLVALHKDKVLNSAERFNRYFNATKEDHWGLVLPDFHVAGLGIRARAYLTGARIFAQDWNTNNLLNWIQDSKISFISMVPTQIFDLVQNKISAPSGLKKIFVGAGSLDESLRARALELKWPLIETYGMTETSSMIAVKEDEFFQLLPGVEAEIVSEILKIKCNSLLKATVQKVNNQITIKTIDESSWFETQDRAEIRTKNNLFYLKLLGRTSDFVKILGEGVSLVELRSLFFKVNYLSKPEASKFELVALEDSRAGFKIILTAEESVNHDHLEVMLNLFNSQCRPYEKISKCVVVGRIPRTPLGKLKAEELKRIVALELFKG